MNFLPNTFQTGHIGWSPGYGTVKQLTGSTLPNVNKYNELKKDLKNLQRYDIMNEEGNISHYSIRMSDGIYIKYEDIEKLLNEY